MAIDHRYSSGCFLFSSGRNELRYFGICRDLVPLPLRGKPRTLPSNLVRGGGGGRRGVKIGGETMSGHAGGHMQTINHGGAGGRALRGEAVVATITVAAA